MESIKINSSHFFRAQAFYFTNLSIYYFTKPISLSTWLFDLPMMHHGEVKQLVHLHVFVSDTLSIKQLAAWWPIWQYSNYCSLWKEVYSTFSIFQNKEVHTPIFQHNEVHTPIFQNKAINPSRLNLKSCKYTTVVNKSCKYSYNKVMLNAQKSDGGSVSKCALFVLVCRKHLVEMEVELMPRRVTGLMARVGVVSRSQSSGFRGHASLALSLWRSDQINTRWHDEV